MWCLDIIILINQKTLNGSKLVGIFVLSTVIEYTLSPQDLTDCGGDLQDSDCGHSWRDCVQWWTIYVCVQHITARLQSGLLWQNFPHIPHQVLGVPDHHGVLPQPLLHHLLCTSICQAEGLALLPIATHPWQRAELHQERQQQEDQEHGYEWSATEHWKFS